MAKTPDTPKFVVSSHYFNFADQHWWEFVDDNTHARGRLECRRDGVQLTVHFTLGQQSAEHVFAVRMVEQPGTNPIAEYTLLQSRFLGDSTVISWAGGLTIPAFWKVGQILHGESVGPGNAQTGNRVALALALNELGPLHPLPFAGIRMGGLLSDMGQGTHLRNLRLDFAGARGLVHLVGQINGQPMALNPRHWYGGA